MAVDRPRRHLHYSSLYPTNLVDNGPTNYESLPQLPPLHGNYFAPSAYPIDDHSPPFRMVVGLPAGALQVQHIGCGTNYVQDTDLNE